MSRTKFIFQHLQDFIKAGDHTSIKHLLQWEFQKERLFSMKNDDGLTLLHTACLEGQLASVEVMLAQGANVHSQSSVGWTALHAATLGGHLHVVSFLLTECTADPLAKDDMGCLPSDLTRNPEILEILQKYVERITIRKDLESVAPYLHTETKQRSHSHNIQRRSSRRVSNGRAYSMICTNDEAKKLHGKYNSTTTDNVFLQVPGQTDQNNLDINNNGTVKANSLPKNFSPNKTTEMLPTKRNSESEITVTRNKSWTFSHSKPNAVQPRIIGFFKLDRKVKETKNRDSGVFDEENDNNNTISQTTLNNETSKSHYDVL